MVVAYEIQIDIFAGILECQCLMYVSDGYSILLSQMELFLVYIDNH